MTATDGHGVHAVEDPTPALETTRELAREVLIHGPISRRTLAARLGLSSASLTRLAKPLIDRGLLRESSLATAGHVGRPTRPLDIIVESNTFVGISLDGGEVRAVLTDFRANDLASVVVPVASSHPLHVVVAIESAVLVLRAETKALRFAPTAVGVSVEGRVAGGRVLRAPFLDWRDVELARMLSSRLRLPVTVENDVVAMTAAEHWFGAGRGLDRFAVLTVGNVIGYGLVMNGEVVTTADTGLGPAAHVLLDPLGPACPLGHIGCADAMITMPGMSAALSTRLGRDVEFDELVRLAESGQSDAVDVVETAARCMGVLIGSVSNLAMVESLVITGEGSRFLSLAWDSMVRAIRQSRDPEATEVSVTLQNSAVDDAARGAAAVAIQVSILGSGVVK